MKSDGTVWAWGRNDYGQLGDGTYTDRSTPVQVSSLSGVIAVAGGQAHSLAVKSDGTVRAWGYNYNGQLGDGTTTNRSTPVQVSSLSGVVAVSGGGWHSLAVKSDGTVWAWGNNGSGQLGDGTTTQRITPVQVSSLSGVIAVSGGQAHSLAVKTDGTVWAWGRNVSGQLGDGATTSSSTPVQVSILSGVSAVAGGERHSLALKSDGTVWAWGYNYYGELGDGTYTDRNTPVQVSGLNLGVTTTTPTPSPSPFPSPTPVTCTDSYETNDSSSTAYGYLTSGSSYSGKICSSSDVDWFKVNITTSGTISINLTVPSSNDYYVELYGPSYSWVAGNHDVSISYNATTTGNYYIRVLGSNGSYSATNSYTLTYTFTSTTSATPTPSPTPTPTTTPEKEDILKKYAPILYIHPDERYYPTNTQTMLDNSELWEKGKLKGKLVNKNKKNALKLKHLKIYNEEKYYLKLKDTSNEKLKKNNYWKKNQTVYGRLFTDTDTKKTVLQYWFFYVYNDWGGLKEGGNKHEGDWEMIQIILGSDKQPLLITYSFHHGGQTFEWDEEEVGKDKSGNHPFVYVTHGGHGCWNKPGSNAWYQAPNICLDCTDETEEGGDILYPDSMSSSEIQSSSSKYSYTLEDMSNSEQGSEYYWINWKGYWGNQKRMKGIVDLGSSGPSSPPYIDYIDDDGIDGRWKKPILWAVSPNPSDYEICASSNIKVVAHDIKGTMVNLFDNCSVDSICGGCSTVKILYSEKDLIFDVYSLDGEDVNLKISRYDRVTRSTHKVEFDWLEIPKNGKATLRFSPDENPNLEMEIDHDHDGISDYRVSPNYATQNP